MCVSADYIVVKLRVERKLMYEVLHPRVKAVMARFVAVQEDMRHMVGAEYRRDALFHLGANHIDIIGIEFLVGYDKASSSTCHALRDRDASK